MLTLFGRPPETFFAAYQEQRPLAPGFRERFDLHLAECDGCEDYLQQFRASVSTLGKIADADLDPGFRDKLLKSFRDFNS